VLTIKLLGNELWDEENEVFVYPDPVTLEFEHSLVALSKWEELYEKPFLAPGEKTEQELFDYLYCMLVTPDVPKTLLVDLTEANILEIDAYINKRMSGTTVAEVGKAAGGGETISAELIYYWMHSYNIPHECKYWHLNKLFTQIRVHNAKSQKPKKMSQSEMNEKNRKLNAERRKAAGSTG
jgi:hypothetical protein